MICPRYRRYFCEYDQDFRESRRATELEETMRKYVKMTPQQREAALKDLERRRDQLKESEKILEQMEDTVEDREKQRHHEFVVGLSCNNDEMTHTQQ